jgi:restriction system protein
MSRRVAMWEYTEAGRLLTMESVTATECIYCQTPLARLPARKFVAGDRCLLVQFSLCMVCGWWTVYRVHQGDLPRSREAESYSGSIGCLKELDLEDVSIPLGEVRKYIAAKKEKVYGVDPHVFEDIVGSIFQDFGYQVRVTGQRVPGEEGDDGIDVILESSEGTIGIQVRRYKKSLRIEADAIRSLAGALLLGGHTKGIFITTSKFRRGATRTAERYTAMGRPVELVNADQFFQKLGIAQLKRVDITDERINSHILSAGAHIGSGVTKEFIEGENLFDRPVVATIFTRAEMLEIAEDGSTSAAAPDAEEEP